MMREDENTGGRAHRTPTLATTFIAMRRRGHSAARRPGTACLRPSVASPKSSWALGSPSTARQSHDEAACCAKRPADYPLFSGPRCRALPSLSRQTHPKPSLSLLLLPAAAPAPQWCRGAMLLCQHIAGPGAPSWSQTLMPLNIDASVIVTHALCFRYLNTFPADRYLRCDLYCIILHIDSSLCMDALAPSLCLLSHLPLHGSPRTTVPCSALHKQRARPFSAHTLRRARTCWAWRSIICPSAAMPLAASS